MQKNTEKPVFSVLSRSVSFSKDSILVSMIFIFPSSSRMFMFGKNKSSAGKAHTLSIKTVIKINIIYCSVCTNIESTA